ncbi:iron ABC transporter permease (plasmid) [Rhizobium sp. CB3060]|uniref:FecCD family ABC transporter permease n=1 Tax=Rhizobium sp. CB3060 TaxID=3138255 RepID=UPI0021A377D1|nr:iron ABC transporter permease [Rhizobium tropici]UWU26195.1 iron ABC transporter permease [Rhizobium tropici]
MSIRLGSSSGRTYLIYLAALALLAGTAVLSIVFGTKSLQLADVLGALTERSQSHDSNVVWTVRVPRTLVGIAVGMALGLAGSLMQSVTRNPLADPGLLGINAGAAAGVVIAIQLDLGGSSAYVWAALIGAALTTVAVYGIGSTGRPSVRTIRMTLAGVAVNAVMISVVSGVLLMHQPTMESYRFWAVGAIAGRSLEVLSQTGPFILTGVVIALMLGSSLNVTTLGEDLGASLGTNVEGVRASAILATVLLAGAATATAGPIGFVGLVVPHMIRMLGATDQRKLLACSMLIAPVVLLWADIIGRLIARPGEVEVGIVIAFVGAPFFVYLVRRRKVIEL